MKNILCFSIIALLISSCSYSVYDMNKGELKIARKSSYTVTYTTIIPPGATADVSYTDVNNTTQTVKSASGRWEKVVQLPSGQAVEMHVNAILPKSDPTGKLVTSEAVDGVVVNEQVQTGKNKVVYKFAFKLP